MSSPGLRPEPPSLLAGSIESPTYPRRRTAERYVEPWLGDPDTVGRVAVIGAGKMGLPLAAQFADRGWRVTAVDINAAVVASINAGTCHVDGEPGLPELVASAHAAGRLTATTDGTAAARASDVVVLIVPVMLDDEQQPDYRYMDAAVGAIGPGIHRDSLVIFETTLPVGDTRGRYAPRLEELSGLRAEADFAIAFSPERLASGHALRNLAAYPKLVGGLGPASTDRAAAFYGSVLDAPVVPMSSAEAAEFSKLADTTYRDVNIALANEFARYAGRVGVDIQEVIRAANGQPYSHIHQPGLGVGGHCIPVYPHFLLSRAPEMELVGLSRRVNDSQIGVAIKALQKALGGLQQVPVLVLGLTYREGVHELAYSRALPLIERLAFHGADVYAYDPLMTDDEVARCSATPYRWGATSPVRAIVTQTGDQVFRTLDFDRFPELEILFDGRNSLRDVEIPERVAYVGVGVPGRGRRAAPAPAG